MRLFPHCKIDEQQNKRLKKATSQKEESEDKGVVAIVKCHNWVVYHRTRMHSLLKERKSFGETRRRKS